MVQPQKPPVSIRLGDERLARIDAYAKDRHLSRHLALLLMIDEGYRTLIDTAGRIDVKPVPASPAAWPRGAALLPEQTEDPGLTAAETVIRETWGRPETTSNAKLAMHRAAVSAPFGPIRAKPGERFKIGRAKK